jgi:peroxiredoxin (alkyl hydroperoxide reductase subunit C)
MAVEVGAQAPDFTLKDQNNASIALSSFRGSKNVLLVFYPFAFSGICTSELTQIRDDLSRFQNDEVQVLAISTDPVFSLKAFDDAEKLGYPLLSDFWPHGGVAQAYGVFNQTTGFANRGTFLVDKSGIVRFAEMNQPGERRDQAVWSKALERLAA